MTWSGIMVDWRKSCIKSKYSNTAISTTFKWSVLRTLYTFWLKLIIACVHFSPSYLRCFPPLPPAGASYCSSAYPEFPLCHLLLLITLLVPQSFLSAKFYWQLVSVTIKFKLLRLMYLFYVKLLKLVGLEPFK